MLFVPFLTVSFINLNNLVDNYNHTFNHIIKVFITYAKEAS